GTVEGNCIRCPFHAWEFDGQGNCTSVPYATKIPPKAKLGAWPVRERDGMIFVWRHRDGREPDRDLPVVEGFRADEWTPWATTELTVHARSLEILENAADSAHHPAVHRNGPTTSKVVRSGRTLELEQRTSGKVLGRDVSTTVNYHLTEPGFHHVWLA